jgi:hypothetical protein
MTRSQVLWLLCDVHFQKSWILGTSGHIYSAPLTTKVGWIHRWSEDENPTGPWHAAMMMESINFRRARQRAAPAGVLRLFLTLEA